MTGEKRINGDPLYRIFHENSKNFGFTETEGRVPDSWTEISYKTYPNAEKLRFDSLGSENKPGPEKLEDHPLDRTTLRETIQGRRSRFPAEKAAITWKDIQTLFRQGAGITKTGETDDEHRRAYPSGGARYPLEIYIAVLSGSGIDSGLYHYNVLDDSLEILRSNAESHELEFVKASETETAGAAIFLTAQFERTTKKYGDRGYRYALMESGHIAQNLCLVASALELPCRPIGGFIEDEADSFLNLPDKETALYMLLLGGEEA